VTPGFDGRSVLTLELTMTGRKYADSHAVLNTYRELWQRLDRLPGTTASGGITSLPLSGYFAWGPITVEGRVPPPGENFINADQRIAAGRYFQTMSIPLVRGRFFDENDTPEKPRVVIVDEFMARELWPDQDPIGKRIRLGDLKSKAPWHTVVGVVGRVKQYGLDTDGRIALYMPHTQVPSRALYVVLRNAAEPGAVASAVKNAIHELDPDLPIYHLRTMGERVTESMARQRFFMLLLSLFAGVALILATIGVYGVMAFLVNQGTREIGIRIALGASERRVLRLVLGQGMAVAAAGGGIGLAFAFILTRSLRSLLFGVRDTDPLTFVAVALVLTSTAFAATYFPARRAARTDPMVSLRSE